MDAASLTVIYENKRNIIALSDLKLTIGRQACDITIPDSGISRQHASIEPVGPKHYRITDLGSQNGTFVNKMKTAEAVLEDEDRIIIGNVLLVFHDGTNKYKSKKISTQALTADNLSIDALKDEIIISGINEADVEQLKRAKNDLAVIYRSGRIINSILNSEEIFFKILDIIIDEIPNVDYCSVHVINDESGALNCRASRSRKDKSSKRYHMFSKSILNCVLQDMRAMLVFDAMQDSRFDGSMSVEMLNIRSAMCVPLQSKNDLIGVLQASSMSEDQLFREEDLKLLTAIGIQAGSAIERAMLYEKLETEKKALESTNKKLKIAQESLIRSEKMSAIGQLAAGIVHDVKNPLMVIYGHAQLLEAILKEQQLNEADDISVEEGLKEILSGVEHCSEIVNQLLQFARQSPPKREDVQANQLLDQTIDFLKYEFKKYKAMIKRDYCDDLPHIQIDVNQIKQTLINIIMNGLQALDGKGVISFGTGLETSDEGEEFVLFSIRDDGPGMAEDIRKKIFNPFFTTKKAKKDETGGTGLGLSVCHGIIENHGGDIVVESEEGNGTQFTIKLPVQPKGKDLGKD